MPRFTDYRTFKYPLGGRLLQIEIGKVCEQANGQAWVRYGDTVVNVPYAAPKSQRKELISSRSAAILKRECTR